MCTAHDDAMASDWLGQVIKPDKVNIICFPFAGGNSASFAGLSGLFGDAYHLVPLEFPGRDSRRHEAFYTDFKTAANAMSQAILPAIKQHRIMLYGHSMGAWFAWYIAKQLAKEACPPELLAIGAQRAPSELYPFKPNALMDDREMINYLNRFESFAGMKVSMSILKQWILPVIRADLALCETHNACQQYYPHPALVLGATEDTFIEETSLQAWRQHLPPSTPLKTIKAGHFFIRSHSAWVAEQIQHAHERAIEANA
ncbi:putative thioesterase involved in non-ribosomal peptide biosynthesis [Shewanella psychrophila]|uniref:Putative thioesterase involved in non-ribosomal peptide biosynthesis n=1 Tax=Shewanella psychrophila TaxID=225848 RepID=A0A1S6HIS5_9GAMM|nr:alpha/beta fold hydrolase [Shewanella psychrophila]AQS35433.1 putative thioesterase involved in non-ribosomal peptide biosynthesis [Shewanella psychrophila]